MDRGELEAAVARAIVELPGADVSWRPDWDEAAAAAIRVVLAEATRSIEALSAPYAADDIDSGHRRSREQYECAVREALAVLAVLVPPPLV